MSAERPHRRLNLLTGDWVLVSPHRMGRPWQGEAGAPVADDAPSYDPHCYLCPGNARVGGVVNPAYDGPWVFDNDFPALLAEATTAAHRDPLLVQEAETGLCRVICYSPDHARTMARMRPDEIEAVVRLWTDQWQELSARPDIGAVTIFENRGAMMGASNPHPHGQIWATASVPNELAREVTRQADWMALHGSPLLTDYLARELAEATRIVCAQDHFVALVPFWAAWPFETLILPRRPVAALDELTRDEQADLARLMSRLTARYDRVFSAPFPYTMGLHQRPTQAPAPGFVFHMHFYPPLLRSATVRKFMVGFEMLAMAQRDLTPEAAAERLRAVWVD
ncbi:galactose-1-phosphate uridylyltransferase [Candidatus Phycosocius bacilliformis]|uniref:Galactose-1-phosphate uridylyltransferase n=1 Tax=Candidatus Phycosocius bacilliformis TaxID=1445552 RepID=A0A2P2EAD9_9PROT|nr:UDP-glucose--hexose-1-phosphate uridylyltransferase [Candidatus Phycosocius bacilliformis]GBF58022.1 galactose-1-phosphate uridylyltransferase [Candidatus Phycosocius bacilliformis]